MVNRKFNTSGNGVKLIINTKPLYEHEPDFYVQAEQAIAQLQALGALVLFTGGHHRKLAVIDKRITSEYRPTDEDILTNAPLFTA